MKRLEIGLEPRVQHGVLDVLVEREQVWMSFSQSGPNDRRLGSAKGSHSLNRQEECRYSHVRQRLPQPFLLSRIDMPDKTHGYVQLLCGQPPQPLHMWIESG